MDIFDYFDRGCKTSNHGNHGLSSRIIGARQPFSHSISREEGAYLLRSSSWFVEEGLSHTPPRQPHYGY